MKTLKTLALPCFAVFWLCAGYNWIAGSLIVVACFFIILFGKETDNATTIHRQNHP